MRVVSHNRATDTYLELVTQFPLRRIRSAVDHSAATKRLLQLSAKKLDRGASDYLDALVDLIAQYEARNDWGLGTTDLPISQLILHRIEEQGISISTLAKRVGIAQPNLSDMLRGKRAWSKNAIRELSSYLKIRAERFLLN